MTTTIKEFCIFCFNDLHCDKHLVKCTECGFACDRAWKDYKHPAYGLIWLEAGVCRQCWNAFMAKSDKAAKEELLASGYRDTF